MESPLWTLKGIRIKTKPTDWFYWHCPIRGCKTAFEFTVVKFTEGRALQHLQAHANRKKKAEALKAEVAGILKSVETDITEPLAT